MARSLRCVLTDASASPRQIPAIMDVFFAIAIVICAACAAGPQPLPQSSLPFPQPKSLPPLPKSRKPLFFPQGSCAQNGCEMVGRFREYGVSQDRAEHLQSP